MTYNIESTDQLKDILKIGQRATIHFESKRYNGIYQASGVIKRLDWGAVGFEELETNYPGEVNFDTGINQDRIRKIDIFEEVF